MTTKEIQDLIKLVDKSALAEVKLKQGDFELSIRSQKYYDGKQRETVSVYQTAPQHSMAPMHAPAPAPSSAEPVNIQQDLTPSGPEPSKNAGLVEVKSPMVGTFYRSASPDKPSYVQIGDVIEAGSVVCIIEAMKLFNEIETEVRGKVVKVLVDDASPVEYDQPLFLLDPKG